MVQAAPPAVALFHVLCHHTIVYSAQCPYDIQAAPPITALPQQYSAATPAIPAIVPASSQ